MDEAKIKRIEFWIDVQKNGTIEEILSLQNPQEYCGNEDKAYIIKRVVEENDAIQANKQQRWAEQYKIIKNGFPQKRQISNQ